MTSLLLVHGLPNHYFNVYISAYFLAEHGGCNQAIDAVKCQASFPVKYIQHCFGSLPTGPSESTSRPVRIWVYSLTTNTAKAAWTKMADDFDFYRIEIIPVGSGAQVDRSFVPSDERNPEVYITKLIPGYWYVVEVLVVKGPDERLATSTGFYASM
jgi:hypothetical protein